MASKLTIAHEPMYAPAEGQPAAPRIYTAHLKSAEPDRHRHVILSFWEGKPAGYFGKGTPAEPAHISLMFRGPRDGVEYYNSLTVEELEQLVAACVAMRSYARRVMR